MNSRSNDSVDLVTAASELAVHYQTAYRWVRSGVLEASVERGRYRVRRDDLAALTAGRHRARPSRSTQPVVARATTKLLSALVAGDEPTSRALLHRLVTTTALTTVLDGVVAPALRAMGADWQAGALTVCTEHRATEIVGRFVGECAVPRRGRPRGTVVVAAPEGDRHGLPAEMAAGTLRDDHWRVEHLGCDVPVDELVRFCDRHDIDLVVISTTLSDAAPAARTAAEQLRDQGHRVLLGGPGRTLAELRQRARSTAGERAR